MTDKKAGGVQDWSPERLELPPESLRAFGYRIVDMLVEHQEGLSSKPVTGHASRGALTELLDQSLPDGPSDPLAVLAELEQDVLRHTMHVNHPRFFAFIPGPGNMVSALGDALASGFNVIVSLWLEAAGPTAVEEVVTQWLASICGLPKSGGGILVSGGSVANLTGLAVARHVMLDDRLDDAVIYCSDQAHASLQKALRLLGFSSEQVRVIPTDKDYRLQPKQLETALIKDREIGRRPFCIIANAGTTNTGAVDPLPEIATLCAVYNLWFHVDGAYGAAAALSAQGQIELSGLDQADSIAVDPHKWLFQPFECGCILLRDRALLPRTFSARHDYMQDGAVSDVNLCDYGIQLTRGFRALKLWLSLKIFGLGAFRAAIDHGLAMGKFTETLLRAHDSFELVTSANLGIVSFRYRAAGLSAEALDRVNLAIVEDCIEDGFAFVSSTRLRNRDVLRICPINPRTSKADIQSTLDRLAALGDRLLDSKDERV
jgi:glutamate/tyrosine decarboxylase-like PLP-dependent enzyme